VVSKSYASLPFDYWRVCTLYFLPSISKDTIWHDLGWFLMHPMWGVGFFIVVNRAVIAEDSWLRQMRIPSLISVFATLECFHIQST
jgi:hypothetical protein